jgi:PHP family Zn ribbon phosphoesterase
MSKSCQKVVKKFSKVVKKLSTNCQKSCQKVVKKLSKNVKKLSKLQKFDPTFVPPDPSWSLVDQWPTVQQSQDKYQKLQKIRKRTVNVQK